MRFGGWPLLTRRGCEGPLSDSSRSLARHRDGVRPPQRKACVSTLDNGGTDSIKKREAALLPRILYW